MQNLPSLVFVAFVSVAHTTPQEFGAKHAKLMENNLIDTLVDKWLGQTPSLDHAAEMDSTTLRKPGQLAVPSHSSARLAPLPGGHSARGVRPQARREEKRQYSLPSCSRRGVMRNSAALGLSGGMSVVLGGASAKEESVAPGSTNEIVKTVNGIRHKRLGNSGLAVSEVALGTQRWGGTDFNSPDQSLCHRLLDIGVENGINLVDTAEQYPIPDGPQNPEGYTEEIIGNWLKQDKSRRDKLVIATKITGGGNVNAKNIIEDLEGSLQRLGTDHVDLYLLHWPARYTPQANWGQSLEYNWELGKQVVPRETSFREIVEAMGKLMKQGKIRGYGACNDNAVGLLGMAGAAKDVGVPPPCVMQNDYSILNRRIEENGLSEASSPAISNTGFLAYNTLAGGMLTGKYADVPASVDDRNEQRAQKNSKNPRGRMDEYGWGRTLIRYRTEAAQQAQIQYAKLAKENDMSPTELALRFAAGRPAVTSCLVGHTSVEQLEECLKAFRDGPLPRRLQWEIDRVHLQNRLPLFANARTGSDWGNRGEIGERIP